jgi:hypothetical protein
MACGCRFRGGVTKRDPISGIKSILHSLAENNEVVDLSGFGLFWGRGG